MRCPICRSSKAEVLDERPHVPIAQNLLYRTQEAARRCPQGALRIVRCLSCGFAWNDAFDPGLLTYDAEYENNQSLSPAFDRHLNEVAGIIRDQFSGDVAISAVEVGCGQGYFLHRLSDTFGDRLISLAGFDPAFRHDSIIPDHAQVVPGLFDSETCREAGPPPNLVVSRHVIEHVADPIGFLVAIREAATDGTVIAIETPNLQWILDGAVAHDFYYEHCSLFDVESLQFAMESAGFEVDSIRLMLEDQYLLAIGRCGDRTNPSARETQPDNADYAARRDEYVRHWQETFAADRAAGERVALWGAASKGVTLALLLGDRCADLLSLGIDINPARSGTFMPVTGLPVVTPGDAREAQISKAYVVNPAYYDEVVEYCRGEGWGLEIEVVT